MADIYKPIKWAYPVKLNSITPVFEPAMYFQGMSKALSGHYPLAANGSCHPGVHFDFGTACNVIPTEICAIADGEIVAYRMDPEPQLTQYPNNPAYFDGSFVLIRHKLEVPPEPPPAVPVVPARAVATASSAPAAPTPRATPAASSSSSARSSAAAPAQASSAPSTSVSASVPAAAPVSPKIEITLYSLYMHMASWKVYTAYADLHKPPYLPRTFIVKDSVNEKIRGRYLRSPNTYDNTGKVTRKGAEIVVIPCGCTITLGTEKNVTGKWANVAGISHIAAVPGWSPGVVGWIYIGDMAGATKIKAVDDVAGSLQPNVTHVVDIAGSGRQMTKKVIGNLPKGAEVVLGPAHPKATDYSKLLEVKNAMGFPDIEKVDGVMRGWVKTADFAAKPYVPSGNVEILEKPMPVKAGSPIGHLGVYQNHNQHSVQRQLHLELFTSENLKAFIEASRARADKLLDKNILKVAAATQLIAAPTSGPAPTAARPPAGAGSPIQAELYLPLGALNALKPEDKLIEKRGTGAAEKKIYWWNIRQVASFGGSPIDGWLSDENLIRVSPWSFPGFEELQDDAQPVDYVAYQLSIKDKFHDEAEKNTFAGNVAKAKNSNLIKKLREPLQNNTVKDLVVTEDLPISSFKAGLGNFWYAQKTAGLYLHTYTEWSAERNANIVCKVLDPLLGHTDAEPHLVWGKEKERIQKLSFWEKVSGITGGADGKLWFLNPVNTIIYFNNSKKFDIDTFMELYISKHKVEFGWVEGHHPNYVRVPLLADLNSASKENLRRISSDIVAYYEKNTHECWIPYMAYMLATVRMEAYQYQSQKFFGSIEEIRSDDSCELMYGPGSSATATTDRQRTARAYGHTAIGDAVKFKGRGFVQLTWKNNYINIDRLYFNGALDLLNHPEKVKEWDVAFEIMVRGMQDGAFTGKKLSDYITLASKDYVGARRIINGQDKADILAGYAVLFEKLIEESIR